jgi:hypothetical protein
MRLPVTKRAHRCLLLPMLSSVSAELCRSLSSPRGGCQPPVRTSVCGRNLTALGLRQRPLLSCRGSGSRAVVWRQVRLLADDQTARTAHVVRCTASAASRTRGREPMRVAAGWPLSPPTSPVLRPTLGRRRRGRREALRGPASARRRLRGPSDARRPPRPAAASREASRRSRAW